MQCTIQSYKNIIDEFQSGDSQSMQKQKQEIEAMQK